MAGRAPDASVRLGGTEVHSHEEPGLVGLELPTLSFQTRARRPAPLPPGAPCSWEPLTPRSGDDRGAWHVTCPMPAAVKRVTHGRLSVSGAGRRAVCVCHRPAEHAPQAGGGGVTRTLLV